MIRALLQVLDADHAKLVKATVALMALTAIAEGVSLAFLLPIIDGLLGSDPAGAWPWLWGFTAAVSLYALLRYASDVRGFRVATGLLRSMYHRLGDHFARLPIGWFSAQRTGELSVLASRGILDSFGSIAHLLLPYLTAALTPLTVMIVMLFVDLPLGLVAVVTAPAVYWTLLRSKRSMADLDERRRVQEHVATDRTIEFVRAQPLLRAAGLSAQRFAQLEEALHAVHRTVRRLLTRTVPTTIGAAAVVQAAFTAMLLLGAARAAGGHITVPEVIVALILASRCVDPLMALSQMSADVRGTEATLAALERVLAAAPLPEPVEPRTPVRTDLEFDRVSWGPQDRTVLDRVSLQIPAGHRVAVVGPSGAGKSTLLHLIARFHDVDAGSVRIGDVDVRDIAAPTLSEQISFAFQDVFLFDATIEENVRIARPEASDDEVREAIRAAHLDEVAARLPHGRATNVGEEGQLLSGGERQRVSIARTLLKDAPIILLDEISASLDPVSEAAVHQSLRDFTRERTTVTVTHRMHTVRQADRIVFLDQGRVIESGTHEELMALDGRYAEFLRETTTASGRREETSP